MRRCLSVLVIPMFFLMVLLLTGCEEADLSGERDFPVFRTTLRLYDSSGRETDLFEKGEAITLVLSVINLSQEPQGYDLPNTCYYDFIVSHRQGGEAWRWSSGRVFLTVMTGVGLAPGQAVSYTEVWTQIDDNGAPVDPGRYEAEGFVPVNVEGLDAHPVHFTIHP